ncbi:MAG: hypothetical protein JWO82_1558 [Akkermansiaceae bacterium]|nr:hypothetical protein [Akkermansiaceae bacterium]
MILRKLTTRPIWWWERNRPYPIRQRVFALPPVKIAEAAVTLVVLTTPNSVGDAAWTARSLLAHLPTMGLTFAVDGDLPFDQATLLTRSFPGCRLVPTRELVARVAAECPHMEKLSRAHPMGRKLASIFALHKDGAILFSDNDVLAFAPLKEVSMAMDLANHPGLYLQEVGGVSLEPAVLAAIQRLGLGYAETINVGLLLIPQGALDLKLAEEILEHSDGIASWFPDTMVLAALMHAAGALPLPRETYSVSPQRQFYFEPDVDYPKLSLRHFTGPVRHLMYSRGMPLLWRRWRASQPEYRAEAEPLTVANP